MVMIVWPPVRAHTEWYEPWPAGVRGRHLIEPFPGPSGLGRMTSRSQGRALRGGGPKRGDPVVAQAGRYHPVSPCLGAYGSSPLRPVHMSDICGTAH